MFATKVFVFLAIIYGLASPSTAGHLSKAKRTHKVLDIIHRLLNVVGHGLPHYHDHFVAFDVSLTHDFTGKKTPDIIPFDKITINIGRTYHKGVFICPINGVYEFNWTTRSRGNGDCLTSLYVNGSEKRRNYNYDRTGRKHQQASRSVIIRLNKEDKVFIGIFRGHITEGSKSEEKSSFQGKLLIAT